MNAEAIKKPLQVGGPAEATKTKNLDDISLSYPRLIVTPQDHLRYLHRDSHPAGFAHIWIKEADRREKQYHSRRISSLNTWDIPNKVRGRGSIYTTINPLYRYYRKNDNVSNVQWIYVDVDAPPNAPLDWQHSTTMRIREEILDKGILPEPNARVSSGRGIWLLWRIDPISIKYTPDMDIWKGLTREFSNTLKKYGADMGVKDPARVMRLAGTINKESVREDRPEQTVTMVVDHDDSHDIEEVAERYFPSIRIPSRHIDTTNQSRNSQGPQRSHGKSIGTLLVDRMGDLERLVALRDGDFRGCRNNALYIYASCGVMLYDMSDDEVSQKVVEFNKILNDPLPMREVTQILRSAKRRPNGYKADSNTTIIEKLDIDPLEQKQMKTIIGKEEYRDRERIRKRKIRGGGSQEELDAKRKQDRQNNLDRLQEAIAENPDATNAELEAILGISKKTLKRWKKALRDSSVLGK